MKIIDQAKAIPLGSVVSKIGESERFILMDRLPTYEMGKFKQEETLLGEYRLLAVNTTFGLGTIIPSGLELIWFKD
jgi:hypothetical protein